MPYRVLLLLLVSFCYGKFHDSLGIAPRMREMKVLHGWSTVDFVFPTVESKKLFIKLGHFISGNAVILDSDYWAKGNNEKLFVTLPRMRPGIPVTLGTVSKIKTLDDSPLVHPYPDWSWHGDNDCEGLISVFRVKVDECNRLWVIDSGVVNIIESARRVCPPKLLAFDLRTDRLILKYNFPEDVLAHDSLLVTVTVDVVSCGNTFVYVADVTEFALIVFDLNTGQSWRVVSNYFYPNPRHGTFQIGHEDFDLMDGVMGLALSPPRKNKERFLYFHSLASLAEGRVSTLLLRNASNFKRSFNFVSKRFYLSDDVRSSQSAAQDMSENKILFFGLLSPSAIACWNAHMPYSSSSLVTVAQNISTLQFASGVKIIRKNGVEELLVTSSKFHSYFLGSLDRSIANYHILTASVSDLVKDTLCDPQLFLHKPRKPFYYCHFC